MYWDGGDTASVCDSCAGGAGWGPGEPPFSDDVILLGDVFAFIETIRGGGRGGAVGRPFGGVVEDVVVVRIVSGRRGELVNGEVADAVALPEGEFYLGELRMASWPVSGPGRSSAGHHPGFSMAIRSGE